MSLSIGGMSNPFKKVGGVNPFIKSSSAQQVQNNANTDPGQTPAMNLTKGLKPEEQEEQLRKYSKCMSAYALAMLNMQSSGGGMVGTETCGSVG